MKRLIASTMLVLASVSAWAAGTLQPLRAADVATLYAGAHEGPLAVEIWSLDCGYCRENAAHLVAWQRRHPDVRVAMIAMDAYDDNLAALEQALAQMNLPPQIAQYANAEPMPERLRAALDAGWRGEMPRTVWIARDGAREARSGLLTDGVLDGWLQRTKRR
ncbi:TlpA family protein disulfide reductase [Burkholderia multivorans]|uniref:TlpA family protein disulfide reductase n=1 Tax=Burkholderia multivorans TaxID=87883 RepID=UPI002019ED26|nr:TlpA family protein disulfide reductase [Burkholderia multivorans]MCO1371724.1 TlpA family protein disulfide reductase [Burkholderia multivorans]MCO1457029.1 TlpA family protein disulfide reductase [Burkholderia multivorans]MCO1466015.1 TlpA family protein disulfide reductase [Burkholderia multivorans]UQO16282.1 TlpA family protein disulfide reductase [Burkholderia multivorans]UQO86348.1 TlpA family protein disulfide reductase [Burkholderia multivorans]